MPEFNEPPRHAGGDPELPLESPAEKVTVTPVGKRKRVTARKKRSLGRRITYWVVGTVALALIAYGGFYAYIFYKVENNIRQSGALGNAAKPSGKGMDLLLMGLDTRLDENGHALPADVYNALHAGDAQSGGNNSNVLMYVHVSDDGSKAFAVSIPRDDWVTIANCATNYSLRQFVPSGCKGKIKSAYGWALANYEQTWSNANGGKTCTGSCYQQAKDAARLEEIQTVENFLQVKISSFAEVTMGAFYQIAQQVQPINVCVKEDTVDSFSGANFKKGYQDLSAKQAVAFVRQRRDLYNRYNFSDLDRSRRQQAFIVSLLTQMKSAGTLLNPFTLNNIVDVATNNVVISKGLNPIDLAKVASNLSGKNLHFYTLPVVTTNYSPPGSGGESANEVNDTEIRTIVRNLLNPPKLTKTKPQPLPSGAGYTVNAINSAGVNHAAADELAALAKHGYKSGTATDGTATVAKSTISYNPTDKAAAEVLAKRLGGTLVLVSDSKAKSHVLTLTIGTALANAASGAPTSTVLPAIVSATGGGTNGPATNQLSDLSGGGIPCVK